MKRLKVKQQARHRVLRKRLLTLPVNGRLCVCGKYREKQGVKFRLGEFMLLF